MDLQLDDEQELLQQSLRRYLQRHLPFETRRKQSGAVAFAEFWDALNAELGMPGAGLPEICNGFDGGPQAEMIVAAELGRALAVTPYVDCHVLTANLLVDLGKIAAVQRIAAGDALVVTALEEAQTRGNVALIESRANPSGYGWVLSGTKLVVNFADQADEIIIPVRLADDEPALFQVPRELLTGRIHALRLVDDTPSADIVLDGLSVTSEMLIGRGALASTALERAVDRAIAALCAEASAIAEVMVEDAVTYSKERTQFGKALSTFQVLQHRMVDMYMEAQGIAAASLLATLRLDDPSAVSAAKVTVSESLRRIAQEAVQLHGAMGLTEELRVGQYFKRAMVIESRLGNSACHLERYRQRRFAA